jgi:hypothetical protein
MQVASRTQPMSKIWDKVTLIEKEVFVFEQSLEHLVGPLVANTVSDVAEPLATDLDHIWKSRLQLYGQTSYQIILHR